MRQLLFLSREGIMQASQKFSLSATFIYATLKKTLNTLHYIILDIARNACFQKQK